MIQLGKVMAVDEEKHAARVKFETTGIISVDCSGLKVNGSDAIYTLDGRKADSNTKGIVIRGGKKFVVR